MNPWRFECKDNNAAVVEEIMPGVFCWPLASTGLMRAECPIETELRSQKELDINSEMSIITLY